MDNSILYWHDVCHTALGELYHTLGHRKTYEEQPSQEAANDFFGRFNIWAGNIGAGRPGHASLDYRLREASEIRDEVVHILQYLAKALQEATSIVSGTRLPYDQLDPESDSSVSSLSDDGAQESHRSPDAVEAPPATELQELQHSISSYLSNLYHMSIFIRRKPAPYDRLLRSAKIDTKFYEFFDQRHVLEKFPRADLALIERLGRAITKRRKYFKYREQHRQKLSQQRRPDLVVSTGGETSGPGRKEEDGPSVHEKAIEVVSDIWTTSLVQSFGANQSTTASTLFVPVTAPLNTQSFDQQSDAGTQTSYGTVSSIRPDRLSLPPLPQSSDGGREFECPYCFTICQLRSLDPDKQEKEWKRHLLTDLQPYICTFGNCSKKDTLFERRRDWISHELHSHRTQWYCNAPGHRAYESQETFQTHMKDEHRESFEESQLEALAKMVARPAVDLKFSCPLRCSDRVETFSIDKLEAHLGRHLEIIATFALPPNDPSRTPLKSTPDGSIVTQGAVQDNSSDSEIIPSVGEDETLSDVDRSSPAASLYSLQDEEWGFLHMEAEPPVPSGEVSSLGQEIRIENMSDWLEVDGQSQFLAKLDTTKHPGTTQWILEFPKFLELTEGKISFLLLEGLPGCGKTMLASTIIRSLQNQVPVTTSTQLETGQKVPRHPLGCAYYFFRIRPTAQLELRKAIRCLIAQLIIQQAEKNDRTLVNLQMLGRANEHGASEPNLDETLDILQTSFDSFEETILILDGLDLCTDDMIRTISRIVQKAIKRNLKVRLVAFSRISMNAEDAIEDRPQETSNGFQWFRYINCALIPRENIAADINVCVGAELGPIVRSLNTSTNTAWLSDADLSSWLAQNSNGMFIWAAARLEQLGLMKAQQQLKLSETLEYIQSQIADVPIMVHRLWFSILERIPVPAESGYTTTIRDILNLLSVCERHMIAEEVDGGLSFDLRNLTWYNYRFSDRYGVWRHFPALLELVGQPGKNGNGLATDNLRFVHPSLQQLLQSDSMRNGPLSHFAIDAVEAQQGVAERCVSHLLRHSTADSYRSKYGWTAYAGAYWHTHVRKLASHASQDLITRSISLLNPRTPSFVHWTHMTKRDRVYGTNAPADFQVQDLYPTPLYYAALFGLHECALKLLTDGADVNAGGGQHGCPLAAAVVAGEECLGLKLLDAGAETGNAALKAAEFGRHQILQKLLANGANVLDRDGLERNMVHWSARNNHLLCLRILAKFSPGLEASDVYGNTPLHLASIYGNTDCIQFFLSHGVNIEAEDAQSRTPLVAAATKGQHEALLLLLENGAEVDAYDSDMQTALCYAAASANPDVVTSLLSHGANPNVQARSDGSTPLHMAVTSTPYVLAEDVRKTKSMVEALLRYGADHSIKDVVGHVAEDKTSDPELKTLLRKPRSDFAPENKLIGPRDKILSPPQLTFEEVAPLQDPSIWLPGFNDLPAEEQEHIKGL